MDFVMTQYIEINIIGIVLLFIMLFYIVGMHLDSEKDAQRYLVRMLTCNVTILFADICIYLFRGHGGEYFLTLNHLLCILYYSMHSYFGYLWLRYSMKKLYPEYKVSKKLRLLFLTPCFINWILAASSPWTSSIYYLTENNTYFRGELLWLSISMTYLYWIISALMVVREIIQQKRIRENDLYAALLVFPIPTLIGNYFQLKYYGLTIVWVCSAIFLLFLFINLQQYQLSRDVLTGLFNRRQTNKQLSWNLKHIRRNSNNLFVMMIDVDYFKSINDKFGHLTGDQALITVAKLLRDGCREKDFIARIGGDEFLIMGIAKNLNEVKEILKQIYQSLDNFNSSQQAMYSLSLSIGYEIYDKGNELTIDDIISSADKKMYQMKLKRKSAKSLNL